MSDWDQYEDRILDYLDGDLNAEAAADLRRFLEADDRRREEFEWVSESWAALNTMGDQVRARVPRVDLAGPIMDAVKRVSEPARPPVRRLRPWPRLVRGWGTGLAAAAALFLAVALGWWLTAPHDPDPGNMTVAELPAQSESAIPSSAETPETTEDKPSPATAELAKNLQRLTDLTGPMRAAAAPELETTDAPDLSSLTVEDLIAARRDISAGKNSWASLLRLATLDPEAAKAVVDDPDASPEAIVGASSSLSPEQAEEALLTAVGHLPDAPYVRFAVVRAQEACNAPPQTIQEQLAVLRELDPDNALALYIEAKMLLDAGETEAALEVLAEARKLREAGPYPLDSSAAREQALAAGGADPEAAKLLSALTAGVDEYEYLCDLGNDLIDHGEEFQELGELEAAQEILESVQQLGEQIEAGATVIQEQLAGLDIQYAATLALEGLYTALGSFGDIEALTAQTFDLVEGFESIVNLFAALDAFLFSDADSGIWALISDVILQTGDLNILDELQRLGLALPGDAVELVLRTDDASPRPLFSRADCHPRNASGVPSPHANTLPP